MSLSDEQLTSLAKLLGMTREEELTCDECLRHMAEFAQVSLAGRTVPEGLRAIDEHLRFCGECQEEFQALRDALQRDSEGA